MMKLTLQIWRQKDSESPGRFERYLMEDLHEDMSFLEMLDQLNEQLIRSGQNPVAFDHDCREGICGQCGMMINGRAHGPENHLSTCQIHLRAFQNGEELWIEPFRAKAFPLLRDLRVDRSALDRILVHGGYISVNSGQAPPAHNQPIAHELAENAFDAASCIGCGACVASCKNASAALFTAAKISHLNRLPQGKAEASSRTLRMVYQMDKEGFGACSNTGACHVECPQAIDLSHIAFMMKEWRKA